MILVKYIGRSDKILPAVEKHIRHEHAFENKKIFKGSLSLQKNDHLIFKRRYVICQIPYFEEWLHTSYILVSQDDK